MLSYQKNATGSLSWSRGLLKNSHQYQKIITIEYGMKWLILLFKESNIWGSGHTDRVNNFEGTTVCPERPAAAELVWEMEYMVFIQVQLQQVYLSRLQLVNDFKKGIFK